ncbi:MAG: hypothetical protein JXQ81_03255 [Desulfuromonadales bacterium]|nr:hypothetical protein [Desulfuromonadales bacterium]MBN2791505.1 hypothetical protein [Desulfuromonadales bacterium]
MARPSFLKRKFYIKKQFQGRFVLLYTLAISLIAGLGIVLLYWQIDRAVEQHLYKTHIKIARVSDFLVDLLFNVNFAIIGVIFIAVLIISLLVFRRINRNFLSMNETIQSIARGNFSRPFTCEKCLMQAGELTAILEQARINNRFWFEQLRDALNKIETGLKPGGDQQELERGREKLNAVLEKISLT